MTSRPGKTGGMRHVALFVEEFEDCVTFYTDLLGMEIEWQPDPDNVYLTSGNDNLALHRWSENPQAATAEKSKAQTLDHIGFIIDDIDDVDKWHNFFVEQGVKIAKAPKTHRDGARSFYCFDPAQTLVQIIYHPPISKN